MGMSALEVRRRVMLAQPHEAVASGAVASFRTDVLSPLKMSFDLLPIQTGEGDPSPDNIRPITGHDGFTRYRTGKNLFTTAGESVNFYIDSNGARQATNGWNCSDYISVMPGVEYTFNPNTTYGSAAKTWYYDENKNRISYISSGKQTFTTPANCRFMRFSYRGTSEDIQLELGDTDTTYEAPSIVSKETTFPTPPGTVYGCHIRDNGDGTGTLTVCKVKFIPTSADSIGTASTGVKYIACYLPTGMSAKEESIYNECISSEYKFRGASAPSDSGWFRVQPNIIYIFDDRFTSKATAESILADEKPQFVYELATPVQYTLSLTALQSLIGQNHIWVDNADEVSVEYWGH